MGNGDGYSVCPSYIPLTHILDISSRGSDLNLPICGVSAMLVARFLRLPTPPGTTREKLAEIDWMWVCSLCYECAC